MAKTRLCILCGKNPAELPDRERMGRPTKRVCRSCHAARLSGDFAAILRAQREVDDESPDGPLSGERRTR